MISPLNATPLHSPNPPTDFALVLESVLADLELISIVQLKPLDGGATELEVEAFINLSNAKVLALNACCGDHYAFFVQTRQRQIAPGRAYSQAALAGSSQVERTRLLPRCPVQ
jgi:hypothetical protein